MWEPLKIYYVHEWTKNILFLEWIQVFYIYKNNVSGSHVTNVSHLTELVPELWLAL